MCLLQSRGPPQPLAFMWICCISREKQAAAPMPLSPVWWGLKCHWFLLPLCARLARSGDRRFWCLKYEPGRRMFLTVKDCFLAAWLCKSLMQFGKLFPGTPVKLELSSWSYRGSDGRGKWPRAGKESETAHVNTQAHTLTASPPPPRVQVKVTLN